MKLKKNLLLLSMILLSSLLTSCAQVPDVPVCKELTPYRAHCTYTISPKEKDFIIDDEHPWTDPRDGKEYTWWEMRPVQIQVPPYSWAELKKYIIKQCRITKNCRSDIGEWFTKMEPKK